MAKTQTSATVNPLRFATGSGVYYEDFVLVAEMLNHIYGNCHESHISIQCGADGWGSNTNEIATHGVTFKTTSGLVEKYMFRIRIDPDTVNVLVGAECFMTGSDVGDVKITVGGTSATLSTFNVAANGTEKTSTLATSSTGTGWQTCTVELNHTTGSSAVEELRFFRVQDSPISSGLPDPVLE